jgi:hypothetical protein
MRASVGGGLGEKMSEEEEVQKLLLFFPHFFSLVPLLGDRQTQNWGLKVSGRASVTTTAMPLFVGPSSVARQRYALSTLMRYWD